MDAQSEVSVCCGAERLHPDMDLCPSCMEHTSFECTDFWDIKKEEKNMELINKLWRKYRKTVWLHEYAETGIINENDYKKIIRELTKRGTIK